MNNQLSLDWSARGGASDLRLGFGLGAGDFRGTGEPVVVFGVPGLNADDGGVFGFDSTGAFLDAVQPAPSTGAQAGGMLRVGDLTGDGFDDLAIAAPLYNAGSGVGGATLVLTGAQITPTGLSGSPIVVSHDQPGAAESVGLGIGDFNNDGWSDLATGGPFYDGNLADEGTVHLYSGSSTGVADSGWTVLGGASQLELGGSIAVGDFNGDGIDDFAAGRVAPLVTSNGGGIDMFLGRDGDMPLTTPDPDWTFTETTMDADCGRQLSSGDVDGDGIDDLVILCPGMTGASVLLLYGSDAAPGPAQTHTLPGTFPSAVAVGDVTGDGAADILVGDPEDNGTRGRVALHLGPPVQTPYVDAGIWRGVAGAALIGMATHATPPHEPAVCRIDFGDGSPVTTIDPCDPTDLETLTHTWQVPARYVVRVVVTGVDGIQGESASIAIIE